MANHHSNSGKITLRAGSAAAIIFACLCSAAVVSADDPPAAADSKPIDSTTVTAVKDRAAIEREVRTFVSAIAVKPGDESLARWQPQIPLCPLVAGMPGNDGEYILSRISKAATAAGAPLAAEHCKGNLFVVVTSDPEGVIKAWSKRDVRMFGEETDQGGAKIREFFAASPVHVWYNPEFYQRDGTPLGNSEYRATGAGASASRLEINNYRALSSVMVVLDTRRLKGVSYGQVAAYVAMVGLAQIRPEANVRQAPTILNLFAAEGKAPPGLTAWDVSFLKAMYTTRVTDRAQIAAIQSAMVQDVAP